VTAIGDISRLAGIDACPEGSACFAALRKLTARGEVGGDDRVVLFNTGTGLKHPELRAS